MIKYKHLHNKTKKTIHYFIDLLIHFDKDDKFNKYIINDELPNDESLEDKYNSYIDGVKIMQEYTYAINYKNFIFLIKQELFKKGYKYKEVMTLTKKINIIHQFDTYYIDD